MLSVKSTKMHARDIFAGEGFVFPLRRPLSVALLLLSHVFKLGKFF